MAKVTIAKFADVDEARSTYLRRVDQKAEELRQRFITSSPGQTMTYEAKFREAQRFLAGGDGPFPWLEAEAQISELDVAGVAASIIAAREMWEQAGVIIEQARLAAKDQIRQSSSAVEMRAIAAGLSVEALGLPT